MIPWEIRITNIISDKNGKTIEFSDNSREALEKGVNIVANAVKVTVGPKAKNVVIDRKYGSPDIVNDGSTVAKEIDIDNPISNLGAKLIEEVASKTKEVGRWNYNCNNSCPKNGY